MASSTTNGETATAKTKLHGRAFYESIGSPKFVLAPMVDQSEFAWRMLTRSFLTPAENSKVLAYTPMFHARLFEEAPKYRDTHFEATQPSTPTDPEQPPQSVPFLDGNPAFDRPLFVQFCANDPEHLLGAATQVAPFCDAVDLNLGCPQGIARKGHYGAFLQENQELIYKLINTLHKKLPIPITAKIRILENKEDTLAYAKNVLDAGASIITVHGRRRDQKGHLTGVADWEYLRYLRDNLPKETVIFANGNILQHGDLERCLEITGADAVMSAEGNLSDPAIFAQVPAPGEEGREYWRGKDGKGGYRVDGVFRRYMDIIHKHVLQREPPTRRPLFVIGDDETWIAEGKARDAEQDEEGPARKKRKKDGGAGKSERCTSPNLIAIRPHLFHLLRHFISVHTDIRDALARCYVGDIPAIENVLEMVERRVAEGLVEYERTGGKSVEEAQTDLKAGLDKGSAVEGENGDDEDDLESSVATVRKCKRPWWVAQPIVRPLPKEALANGSISLSKKEKKKRELAAMATGEGEAAEGGVDRGVEGELPVSDCVDGVKEPSLDAKRPADELVCG
ncbi:FMN-linked oxidoreductase [Annulohypoxylon maeteangense]|uniref:FMN-linked oxidoreductase n=1 Tax=Annulohypoxylon maeteangense TaxID=1927788 RepID=UPI00200806B5|nr:FMN-linked oxidoreductase [Annulohypoxylon maeteangense]KAI0883535.1 FMN-linked oxidoreductase [Annulohypoxylon maeteangense]